MEIKNQYGKVNLDLNLGPNKSSINVEIKGLKFKKGEVSFELEELNLNGLAEIEKMAAILGIDIFDFKPNIIILESEEGEDEDS